MNLIGLMKFIFLSSPRVSQRHLLIHTGGPPPHTGSKATVLFWELRDKFKIHLGALQLVMWGNRGTGLQNVWHLFHQSSWCQRSLQRFLLSSLPLVTKAKGKSQKSPSSYLREDFPRFIIGTQKQEIQISWHLFRGQDMASSCYVMYAALTSALTPLQRFRGFPPSPLLTLSWTHPGFTYTCSHYA